MKNNIAYFRKQKGLSQADLAAELGMHWTNLSKIENDRSDPGMERFKQIANSLGVKLPDLFAELDEVGTAILGVAAPTLLPFAGEAQAGVWRDVEIYSNSEPRAVAIQPDPRYRNASQYIWGVKGDSMDRAGILDGMFALGVDYVEFVKHYRPIATGDIVVVERLRFGGQERERTIKRYREDSDGVWLLPESTNPLHKPIHIPRDGEVEGEEIRILAYVTGAHNIFGQAIFDLDEGQKIPLLKVNSEH